MIWVAKNDITGKEYPKKFKDIYECQKYIDTELVKLQFIYGLALGLENEINDEEEFQKWYKKKNEMQCIAGEIFARIEYAISKITISVPKNPRNNVIRCYNKTQNRWATGFDF